MLVSTPKRIRLIIFIIFFLDHRTLPDIYLTCLTGPLLHDPAQPTELCVSLFRHLIYFEIGAGIKPASPYAQPFISFPAPRAHTSMRVYQFRHPISFAGISRLSKFLIFQIPLRPKPILRFLCCHKDIERRFCHSCNYGTISQHIKTFVIVCVFTACNLL